MIIMMVLGCSGIVYITITVSKYMKIALAEEETASLVYNEDDEKLLQDKESSKVSILNDSNRPGSATA
jgi:archaellum component FlaF (FlaF/FlaG flagellin family)